MLDPSVAETEAPWRPGAPQVSSPVQAALARHYLPARSVVWQSNRLRLLRDGAEAYPAMLDAIRGARRAVRLETFTFLDDGVGRMFGRALSEAARRGVEVSVLYDAFGSWGAHRAFFKALRDEGVDARAFRPVSPGLGLARLLRRDHRKLLVVDGRVAFVGGINIASQWAPKGEGDGWRDDVLRVEGTAVRALARRFGASWRMEAKVRLQEWRAARTGALPTPGEVGGAGAVACVASSRRAIHRAYLHALGRAERCVLVAAAYFLPDRKMLAAMKAAIDRGVEVSLILPGRSDHPLIRLASQSLYERLLGWGVRLHEWKEGVLHAKTAVVDGAWGTVGSFNLERLSLRFNYELNVFFVDRQQAGALERAFRSDCERCERVEWASWRRRPRWHRAAEWLAFLLRWFL